MLLFSNTIGVGGFVYNVAGTVLFTGCVFNANGVFYQSSGIGYLSFNSAGLSIFTVRACFAAAPWVGGTNVRAFSSSRWAPHLTSHTHQQTQGCVNNFQLGCAVFFGGGLGMMTGSGVTVLTGLVANVEGALSAGAGMGFQSAIGSGVVIRTGIIQV